MGYAFTWARERFGPEAKAQPNQKYNLTARHSHSSHRAAKPKLRFLVAAGACFEFCKTLFSLS